MTSEERTDARHWTSERFKDDPVAHSLAAKLLPKAMDALERVEALADRWERDAIDCGWGTTDYEITSAFAGELREALK